MLTSTTWPGIVCRRTRLASVLECTRTARERCSGTTVLPRLMLLSERLIFLQMDSCIQKAVQSIWNWAAPKLAIGPAIRRENQCSRSAVGVISLFYWRERIISATIFDYNPSSFSYDVNQASFPQYCSLPGAHLPNNAIVRNIRGKKPGNFIRFMLLTTRTSRINHAIWPTKWPTALQSCSRNCIWMKIRRFISSLMRLQKRLLQRKFSLTVVRAKKLLVARTNYSNVFL